MIGKLVVCVAMCCHKGAESMGLWSALVCAFFLGPSAAEDTTEVTTLKEHFVVK